MPSNWSNRTLWTGDNLDIMRGMNSETVDLIYLDPPFNSNRDYAAPIGSEAAGAAFKDTWALSDVDEAWHGEIADRDPTDKPTFNVQYVPVSPGTMKRWKGRKQQAVIEGGVRYAESTAAESRNPCPDWWEISIINPNAKERVGYPTQKPLALLDRIIKVSSNDGDIVLDPFAGCATACVAAERLQREWVGIDLSPLAAKLVKSRLRKEMGLFYDIHHRTDIPSRTDLGELPNYRTHKHMLYGKLEG